MNQAAIHRALQGSVKKDPTAGELNRLFEKRLAANYTLLQQLFFSLYPESQHRQMLIRLQEQLHILFRSRSRELKLQDIRRLGDVEPRSVHHRAAQRVRQLRLRRQHDVERACCREPE